MNRELQLELVRQAHESANPIEFWAYCAAAIAGFAQEHIGTEGAAVILQAAADDVAGDLASEMPH